MGPLEAYLPIDRRHTIAENRTLADCPTGAALFADISGSVRLTQLLAESLGPKGGAEEIARQLNRVFEALIAEIYAYGGTVVSFSGDALTCWFEGDNGRRATASALRLQQAMLPFQHIPLSFGATESLAIKVGVASGPARRFVVGDPQVHVMDVLAGATVDRMAKAEQLAERGQVVVSEEIIQKLGPNILTVQELVDQESSRRFAVVSGLASEVETMPWPQILSALPEDLIRPWLLPAIYERLKGGHGRFLSEMLPVVTLFCRVDGINYDQDPNAPTRLAQLVQWTQNLMRRHGGDLLKVTCGDKGTCLHAAFGAPVAHDDDAARAVSAAIEWGTVSQELGQISIRIGISQGRAWAGACGGSTRCAYDMLGDQVNLAARFMSKSEAGQILVTRRIRDRAAGLYEFEDERLLEIKGVTEGVPGYVVIGRRVLPPPVPADTFAHSLVGRDAELAQIDKVLDLAVNGQGQILRLEGAAGIGKSRLIAEWLRRAQTRLLRVMVGACHSTTQSIAHHPWRQALSASLGLCERGPKKDNAPASTQEQIQHLMHTVNDVNPEWLVRLPLLADLLELPIPDNPTTAALDSQSRQDAMFNFVIEMIQTVARTRPVVIVIEDAHWLDEASRGLTLALGRVISTMPTLLVIVHRTPEHDSQPVLPELERLASYTALRLGELSPQQTADLVRLRLGGVLSPLALDVILAVAEGNPFLAEELVETLCDLGLLQQRQGQWSLSDQAFNALRNANCLTTREGEWALAHPAPLSAAGLDVPEKMDGLVRSRLDRMPEEIRLTLKVASVIGHTFSVDLLARSHPNRSGLAVLRQQLKVAIERDLLRLETEQPQLTYSFKLNLIQEAIYDALTDEQKLELHESVGAALEQLEPDAIEPLAYHFARSARRDKQLIYLGKAALKAQREFANETALNYYDQALALEKRWEWIKGRVEVLHILGRRDDERAGLVELETMPDASAADVAYLWGQYYDAISDFTQAQAKIEQASAAYHAQADGSGETRCLIQWGTVLTRQGELDQAKTWYSQALNLLQYKISHADEEAQSFARALNGLGIVYGQQGQFEHGEESIERALGLTRADGNRLDEAQAFNNRGLLAGWQCNFAQAVEDHQQALKIRRTIGHRIGVGSSLYNLAITYMDAGDLGMAQDYLLRALPIHQATGHLWDEAKVRNDLGVLFLLLGQGLQARASLQYSLSQAREIGDRGGEADALCNLGLCYMGIVAFDVLDLNLAEQMLNPSLELATSWNDTRLVSMCHSYLALVYLQARRWDQAIQRASVALTLRRSSGLESLATMDLTTLAAAHQASGDMMAALNYAQQAISALDKCQCVGPEFPQRDYFICYQAFLAAGRMAEAFAALRLAHCWVVTKAKKITNRALRRSFRQQVVFNREITREYRQQHLYIKSARRAPAPSTERGAG